MMKTTATPIQRCACGKTNAQKLAPARGFEAGPVQRSALAGGREFGAEQVHPGVLRPSSGGAPLPYAVQTKMEAAFGHDFANVRVHHGDEAPSIGAAAFTRGTHLHFAPGRYQPHTPAGQRLLGHELAHVVQQHAGRVERPGGLGINADPALEREADAAGARAATGQAAGVRVPDGAGTSAPAAAPVQRAPGGVWRNKNSGAYDWSKDESASPGGDWEWVKKEDYLAQHASLRTRSDQVIDPSTGTSFYRSGSAKLYAAPLSVRPGVNKAGLTAKHGYTVHSDLTTGSAYYHKDSRFFDDPGLTTESSPAPDVAKLTRHPVPMEDVTSGETFYESDSGEFYDRKPTLAYNPPDQATLWDASRKADRSPGTWVRMKNLRLEREARRKTHRPDDSHHWMEQDEYADSFKPESSRSDEMYDPVTGTSHYRSGSGKYYRQPMKIAHGVDKTLLKKRPRRESVDTDTGDVTDVFEDSGGKLFSDEAGTKKWVPRKHAKLRPRTLKDETSGAEFYESDSGEVYSEQPSFALPQPDESALWDLRRADREWHGELGESKADFKKRAGPMELWDVAPYEHATARGRTTAGSENDHAPADKSLGIKLGKETEDPGGFMVGGKKQQAKYAFDLPGRREFEDGSTADEESGRGWTQNIPGTLHNAFSPTFRARQSIQDEVTYGGTTYAQNRPAVDAEIPATALHRDKQSLLKGMEATGELNARSWGGARIHMQHAYEPGSGLFDPTVPAFSVTGDPVLKKTAGGKLTYAEIKGKTQMEESNAMLEEFLKKTLKNPKGT